nr:IS1 family transposase [uncultured Holophaga sp.]
MNKLPLSKRTQIVAALVEGNSIRSTCRMTGAAKGTVLKLLVDLGHACEVYQRTALVDLKCRRIQCDEIWSFCYSKAKNVPAEMQGQEGVGDVWTWTALDSDSKLIVSYLVGTRDACCANEFMEDVAGRLAHRVQLTTDGLRAYLNAVDGAFGLDVDFAQLVKIYGEGAHPEKRYSPARYIGAEKHTISGSPDPEKVSTSHVERQNLTMRMSMRRFTRLTNAFSKKIENHEAAIALHFMYYNFARVHQTLRVTPVMEAGIADHPWSLAEIVGLLGDSN